MRIVGIDGAGKVDGRGPHVDQELDSALKLTDLGEQPDVGRGEGPPHLLKVGNEVRVVLDLAEDVLRLVSDRFDVDVVVLGQVPQHRVSVFGGQVRVEIAHASHFSVEKRKHD